MRREQSKSARTSRYARATIAALVLSFSPHATAAGASVEDATSEQSARASDKFRAGADALEAQKLPQALDFFRQSYDVVASPNSRLMIGRTLAKMGKLVEAYREIEAAVAEADAAAIRSDKYKKTAEAARVERDELKNKVGFVVVSVKAAVSVAGTEVESADLGRPIVATPGKTAIVLKLPSGEEQTQTVDVEAGKETRIELGLPAPEAVAAAAPVAVCPPAPPPAPAGGIDQMTLAWVAGGVGVLGMAAFTVFGLLDNGVYSDLEGQCSDGICPRRLADEAEKGRTYQTLANVGLGVGVVGLGTGLVLGLTAPGREKPPQAGSSKTRELLVGPGTVAVRGRF